MTKKRKILVSLSLFFLITFTLTYFANRAVIKGSKAYITSNLSDLKPLKTGLLLGTSKTLKNGKKNAYFYLRIDAAVALYNSSKIKFIIVSGDNSSKQYNEPQDMKDELVKRGIPAHVIYLDYAGFRTLDSVIRARKIFGQSSFIIISQRFHNERAVYIARSNGIEAYGYNAKDVKAFHGIKTKIREYFARDKVFIDAFFGKDPKFLGDKIEIK